MAFVWGAVLGALVGAGIAIFLAPSDGKTFRRQAEDLLGLGGDEPVDDAAPTGSAGVPASEDGSVVAPSPLMPESAPTSPASASAASLV